MSKTVGMHNQLPISCGFRKSQKLHIDIMKGVFVQPSKFAHSQFLILIEL